MDESEVENPELLVVEDDGMHRLVFGAYLRGMGLELIFAASGEDALTRLHDRAFSLVLMDVDLPDVDGLEVTRRLRALEQAHPDRRRTPVVALTALGGSNDVRRALTAGCDGFLVKPVTRDLLRESVSRYAASGEAATRLTDPPPEPTPELRAELVATAGQVIAQLRSSLERGRRDELQRICHKLRRSAATFGLTRVSEATAEIEGGALTGNATALVAAIDRLAAEIERAVPALPTLA